MDCEDRLSLWEDRVWTHVDGRHHGQGNHGGDPACGTSEWMDGRRETAHCAKVDAGMDRGVQSSETACFPNGASPISKESGGPLCCPFDRKFSE